MVRLRFLITAVLVSSISLLTACHSDSTMGTENSLADMVCTGTMPLEYADQFSVSYYENGTSIIEIADGEQYLLVPENADAPASIPENVTVIHQPVERIYLAASSAMDLFDGIDALDTIRATSTAQKDWSLPHVVEAIANGDILYAGKYSAPDYELILSEECDLAIESTMIYHSPAAQEQLESQGIPVLVERSSYESHPLGRLEWIKLYGLLLGKEAEAEAFYKEKSQLFDSIEPEANAAKTVAFFYIGANGYVNIRKPGDYISKMIELAGGQYIFDAEDLGVEDNALSTMNIQFETFYAAAMDADILIYNSTVDGGLSTMDELTEKNALLKEFKAVQNGNVWCTEKNMFQQTTGAADMIADLHQIFAGESTDDLQFLYPLT